jgi:uncharacterized protein (DUF2147 family)
MAHIRFGHMRTSPILPILASGSVLLAAALTMLGGYAFASDPAGVWLIEDGSAKVRIEACDQALCGKVVWIQQPNDPADGKPWLDKNNIDPSKRNRLLLGVTIASDMKPSDVPGKWVGQVYSIDFGRNYDGSITLLNPIKLKIEGCLLLICQSELWTKAD